MATHGSESRAALASNKDSHRSITLKGQYEEPSFRTETHHIPHGHRHRDFPRNAAVGSSGR